MHTDTRSRTSMSPTAAPVIVSATPPATRRTVRTVQPNDWQADHVDRLWSYWGSRPHHLEQYFSHQVGHGVVALLQHTGRLHGQVLDYGCGPGFLIDHLLRSGIRGLSVHGADTSAHAVRDVNVRLQGRPGFHGIAQLDGFPSPFETDRFDVITCIETLEHLDDATLHNVTADVHRLLRPGGIAMFTTPFAEKLEQNMVYCPFCDSEFHRVQHMRSLTAESMSTLLRDKGYDVLFCGNLNFADFQRDTIPPPADLSPRAIGRILTSAANRLLDRVVPRPFPHSRTFRERLRGGRHLCAVVTK
jgi:2-polyprenyl-3-methyl-5-hydroxy-6-metoxy-1,4-benzoquinol methylase